MIKNMLSWAKMDKDRRDYLIGCYAYPILLPIGIILFGIMVYLAGRYKKAELFFKKVQSRLRRLLNGRI